MTVKNHVFLSFPLGLTAYLVTSSYILSLIVMASSVLIDVDHVLDRIIEEKRISNIREMVEAYEKDDIKKIYLPLHSLDILFPLIALSYYFSIHWITAICVGLIFHISMDILFWSFIKNKVSPLTYFIFYRMRRGFDAKRLLANLR